MSYNRGVHLAVTVTVLWLFGASQLNAQDKKLPDGKKIVEKYVKAAGGEKAFGKVKNITTTADIVVRGYQEGQLVEIKGKMTRNAAGPNKYYEKLDLLGIGQVLRGSDGKVMWEIHPMNGARIISGEEKETMMHFAQFGLADFTKRFRKIECIGEEKVGAEDCYKVKLTPLKAKPYTASYSKNSGLELKNTLTLISQLGEIEVVRLLSDYKTVDGLKYAHQMVEKSGGVDTIITSTSVKHNVELPKDSFELPEEVKKILK